ncbi:MAG: hypothetical protein VB074_05610 [Proteiniphilum sp.]|jgi:hypothetical protein|uniref:hypothetical protein n=1 Tax=Proteiniphilum sp. TaxID=1926877 RepID=UPI002B217474|nr:hypothetical protein [Proteiniphilum sp.]MEA5127638.1 hypothetical protein [Proteiniphilum sp.]
MANNFLIKSVIMFCMAFSSFMYAQTGRDAQYVEYMQLALNKLDSVNTVEELQQTANLFERISKKYPSEWLPGYYVAYCNVNSVFYGIGSSRNEMILMKARERIEELYTFSGADLSEVNTLKAYYFTALITIDPEVNGQKYFSEVIRLYETAIAQDPGNPRPVVLLADFERRLPPFIRTDKRNPDEEKAKATLLFEKENPNIEKPYWGKYFLEIK